MHLFLQRPLKVGIMALAGVGMLALSGIASASQVSALIDQDTTSRSKYDVLVKNTTSGTLSNISARVYLDLSEVIASGRAASSVKCDERYETTPATCTIEQYSGNIYYAKLTFSNSLAPNAQTEYKITLRLSDWSTNWSSSNDYSRVGLSSAYSVTSRIPLYSGSTRISGTEPGASSSSSSSSSSSVSSSSSSVSSSSSSTGAIQYRQNFDALTTGQLWKSNLDSAKPTARPENAMVTASCGVTGNCLRIVYRHADGIHKAPFSNPVFVNNGGTVDWAPSDADHTNTATDVIQQNLPISGILDTSKKTDAFKPAKAYTLTYNVYFEPGFDFAKGGKLPGLASEQFDSGCTDDSSAKRSTSNWSVRLMWRANGRLELYSYDQTRPPGSCGITRKIDEVAGEAAHEVPGVIPTDTKFRLKTGVWYTVRVSVKLNDNNSVVYQRNSSGAIVKDAYGDPVVLSGNGEVSLAIKSADGVTKRLLVYPNVALRDECNGTCPSTVPDSKASQVNALFFSTFHGGNETKRVTCIDESQSTLTTLKQKPLPSFTGLTQARFDALCASQMSNSVYSDLTWNPMTPSAARFDNLLVNEGYTAAPF